MFGRHRRTPDYHHRDWVTALRNNRPMFCVDCDAEMKARKATVAKPYRYDLTGLKNIYLAGITVYHCPRCGAEAPSIPRLPELHRVLALNLIGTAEQLTGDEVRFLRKWLGFSGVRFAQLIGISLEHLSRVEHGHKPLGTSSDRLLRVLALTAARRTAFSEVSKLFADRQTRRRIHKPMFELRGRAWQAAA